MQQDEVVWQIINHGFCSFKVKTTTSTFCKNEYNVSGLCNRQSCPLANSRYATLREHDGVIYLYLKTIERAHMPSKLWEKIKLPKNYMQALERISSELKYFPKYLVHKNKQRLTKIHQYLIRMRKLRLKTQVTYEREHKKQDRRDAKRELKALYAAQLEKSIENQLLERLKAGTYGDIYNFPERVFDKHLEDEEVEDGEEEDDEEDEEDEDANIEYVEDEDLDEEMERELAGSEDVEDSWSAAHGDDVSDEDLSDPESLSEDEEEEERPKARKSKSQPAASKKKPAGKRRPHVEVEYEHEQDSVQMRS